LEIVFSVPIGFGAPGEDGDVIRKGRVRLDGVDPQFLFIAMSNSMVARETGRGEV
jgi:hypothetical protein